jgi:hypothetical protein
MWATSNPNQIRNHLIDFVTLHSPWCKYEQRFRILVPPKEQSTNRSN